MATISNTHDCIVVGAGVVGTALSYALAQDGRKVLLLERDLSEPDRIVGELLQPGGVDALAKLGLADCLKGIDAITNHGYGVLNGDKMVKLVYPLDKKTGEKAWGCSFHHGRFIMKLRKSCMMMKNIEIIEATVNSLLCDDTTNDVVGVKCTLKGKDCANDEMKVEFKSPLTIVADGCFSKFRKEVEHNSVCVRSHFVGAILHDCPLPFPNHGHVVLANPSPILLYQIGTHDTRVLVDVPGKVPGAASGALKEYLLSKVLPQLPKSVQPSFHAAVDSQRLRVMPNSYLTSVRNHRHGLIVLGDALNMRHPLTGGGMTVAFNDVLLLSSLMNRKNIDSFDNREKIKVLLNEFNSKRKTHCTVINVLAQALYELFAAGNDWKMSVLREACFAYFELGGICANHPMGLLSGMIKSPITLYLHFFAVAFYGMLRLLKKPIYPLDKIRFPIESKEKDLFTAGLTGINHLLLLMAIIVSFPMNALAGIVVVLSAARVIFPLIWSELIA